MVKYITKRDGRVVSFDATKIEKAIMSAMESVKVVDPVIALKIAKEIHELDEEVLNIEQIQDIVESKLMDNSCHRTAKEYITYRAARSKHRRLRNDINQKVIKILSGSNIQNNNANVDEHSFGGRKNESASVIQKELALDVLISPEIAEAYRKYRLYIHDLSEYYIGSHNCLFIDLAHLMENGFDLRNGDVRPANSLATACQLVAVAFQIQSQVQFGGVASMHLDYDLAKYVKKSFAKHFLTGIEYIPNERKHPKTIREVLGLKENTDDKTVQAILSEFSIQDPIYKEFSNNIYKYAYEMLLKEAKQAFQGLYHNLNTLESRAGAQVPFTSINFGRDTSPEGRLISSCCLLASIAGIGKFNSTPIFPISIVCLKKGVNMNPEDPNYDIKKLSIQSLSKRIYPNFVNGDWSQNQEDPNDINTHMATMGCADGKETVLYKINGRVMEEGLEDMWERLSSIYATKNSDGGTDYMELHDILAYDSHSKGYVVVHKIIKNRDKGDWYEITLSNNQKLILTSDHPLPVTRVNSNGHREERRIKVKDLLGTDEVREANHNHKNVSSTLSIKKIKFLGFRGKPSYDLETMSDRFDLSCINSHNCRTLIGFDRHGLGYSKLGRGNVTPVTINLPRIGIVNGICLKEREQPDIKGFFNELEEILKLSEKALVDRFYHICSQNVKSASFMYENGSAVGTDKALNEGIYETMKHFTNAIGYTGLAETCRAMFGIDHSHGIEKVDNFAESVIKRIYDFTKEAAERNDLNFSCYASPK